MENVASSIEEYDDLIIGAGPAGLQLGYYLQEAGRSYLILEAENTPGAFFRRFPRHRVLISNNKIHTGYEDPEVNLRFDWNSLLRDDYRLPFREHSETYFPPADAMVDYLRDWAREAQLEIRLGSQVTRVTREPAGGPFSIEDAQGRRYQARRLVVATGVSRPYLPPVPGIELAENYVDVSVDPKDFTGQRVLVIGKGNSGFETADNLIPTTALIHVLSPRPVAMAWKTHHVGHLRAVNNNFLDTYQLKSQNAVLDAEIDRIVRREDGRLVVSVRYSHAKGEYEDLVYDRVITCTGFRFDDSIFDDGCRPALAIHDRFPDQTSAWESTNVPDLYFAGVLTQMRDFKKVTSGFIHGFRYNSRCLFRLLEHRYHGRALPGRRLEATPQALLESIMERVNRSSALWQQFGFLGDLITLFEETGEARHYEELPVDYIHDSALGTAPSYFVVTLEFGKIEGDPFNIPREPSADRAERSTFLHPVVRHFSGPELVGEHHVLENLFGEWRDPSHHVEPLSRFLHRQMEPAVRGVAVGS